MKAERPLLFLEQCHLSVFSNRVVFQNWTNNPSLSFNHELIAIPNSTSEEMTHQVDQSVKAIQNSIPSTKLDKQPKVHSPFDESTANKSAQFIKVTLNGLQIIMEVHAVAFHLVQCIPNSPPETKKKQHSLESTERDSDTGNRISRLSVSTTSKDRYSQDKLRLVRLKPNDLSEKSTPKNDRKSLIPIVSRKEYKLQLYLIPSLKLIVTLTFSSETSRIELLYSLLHKKICSLGFEDTYQVKEILGKGSTAQVYRVCRKKDQKIFAAKLMKVNVCLDVNKSKKPTEETKKSPNDSQGKQQPEQPSNIAEKSNPDEKNNKQILNIDRSNPTVEKEPLRQAAAIDISTHKNGETGEKTIQKESKNIQNEQKPIQNESNIKKQGLEKVSAKNQDQKQKGLGLQPSQQYVSESQGQIVETHFVTVY